MTFKSFKIATLAAALTFSASSFADITVYNGQHKEGSKAVAVQSEVKDNHSALSFRHFKLGALAIFLYVGIEVGIQSIAFNFMKEGLKMDASIVGSVVGTYWFLMLVGRLIGGSLGSKFSSRGMLTFVSVLGIAFVLIAMVLPIEQTVNMLVFKSDISFGLAEVPMSIMFLVLCGLCTSVMWGGIFNLSTEGLGKYTAAASGIFMAMVCGGGILPAIQGAVADVVGYMQSYWVIVIALAYLLFYALVGSKNVNTDIKVD